MALIPSVLVIIAFVIAESILMVWLVDEATESSERIVIGSLSLALFISLIVIMTIIYLKENQSLKQQIQEMKVNHE